MFFQAYKAVVNDATIFKLELPLKQKGWVWRRLRATWENTFGMWPEDIFHVALILSVAKSCVCVWFSVFLKGAADVSLHCLSSLFSGSVWKPNQSQSVRSCWPTTATCCWGKPRSARNSRLRRSRQSSRKWYVWPGNTVFLSWSN